MRQFQIIIFTVLITAAILGIIVSMVEGHLGYFFYVGILMIGNIIIPITIAEIIYEFVDKTLKVKKIYLKTAIEIVLLIVLFQIGIIIWSILDLIIDYSGFEGITFENIENELRTEFKSYIPISILVAVLIPVLDKIIRGKEIKIRATKYDI